MAAAAAKPATVPAAVEQSITEAMAAAELASYTRDRALLERIEALEAKLRARGLA